MRLHRVVLWYRSYAAIIDGNANCQQFWITTQINWNHSCSLVLVLPHRGGLKICHFECDSTCHVGQHVSERTCMASTAAQNWRWDMFVCLFACLLFLVRFFSLRYPSPGRSFVCRWFHTITLNQTGIRARTNGGVNPRGVLPLPLCSRRGWSMECCSASWRMMMMILDGWGSLALSARIYIGTDRSRLIKKAYV